MKKPMLDCSSIGFLEEKKGEWIRQDLNLLSSYCNSLSFYRRV
jgi:hypothetical protein